MGNQHEHEHGHGQDHQRNHDHNQDHAHVHDHVPVHDPDHRPDHRHDEAEQSGLPELLDLDAEVLHSYLSEVTDLLGELTADAPPRRILDLGSGTGTGTLALLRRFDGADVTAVDMSEEMLRRVTDKARGAGLDGSRIRTVEADLDAEWPDGLGPVDLVWAAASLHHMADPDRALAEIRATLRAGGLLAIAEMDASPFPRFLSEKIEAELGRPGLEERLHATLAGQHAEAVPHLGDDWGSRLTATGFAVAAERRFDIRLDAPLPAATGRYARATLGRLRDHFEGDLAAEDLAALAVLLDGNGPDSILRRDDLTVRTTRLLWVGRKV